MEGTLKLLAYLERALAVARRVDTHARVCEIKIYSVVGWKPDAAGGIGTLGECRFRAGRLPASTP